MEVEKIVEYGAQHFLPNLSIDLVIIGYQEGVLKCLLLSVADTWVLPGGYIKMDESVDTSVHRILKERTALEKPHFKFLDVFGDAKRNFSEAFKTYFKEKGLPWKEDLWLAQRFVTLAYYSLVDMGQLHPKPGIFDEAVGWFDFDDLPEIGLDHASIISKARNRIKDDIKKEHLTYNLLPQEFTMPQLHRLHETILSEKLDRSRFQKKMLATEQFERLPKLKKESPGSNPFQYRVKRPF
ncbi:MAG: NUDIX domain-containing protein [Croceivirga sp.]